LSLEALRGNWVVFGPIEVAETPRRGGAWLELPADDRADVPDSVVADGWADVPDSITVDGRAFRPVPACMESGALDFARIFGRGTGSSFQAFAFCAFETPDDRDVLCSADGEGGVLVWLDGQEILRVRPGDQIPDGTYAARQHVHLSAGRHVVCCRVRSASWSWLLRLAITPADARPARPAYADTGLRMENRPLPTGVIRGMPRDVYERTAATCGVEARWISVFNGGPLFRSAFLPTSPRQEPDFERKLAEWIEIIHGQGLPVLSWVPMTRCRPAWEAHPDWRQVFLPPAEPGQRPPEGFLCVNSGYGDALIGCCIEALERFDLDGLWFDGSAFSPVWSPPRPISCLCEACRRKYAEQTGGALPAAFRPEMPEFRRWMAWRYRTFGEYWGRLARQIKAAHPRAAIAINHYHREDVPWSGGVPLNPFEADIITGSESEGDPWRAALYTRVNRAYGRSRSETWITARAGRYELDGQPRHSARPLITQALCCMTAGGDASFGQVDLSVSAAALAELAGQIRPRKPFRNLPSYPFAALHVSQQTDTFTFGTDPAFVTRRWRDHYWRSLGGWHRLLMAAGAWLDVVFDDHLTLERLRPYRHLFAPLTVALSDEQVEVLRHYVAEGGRLYTGRWFAAQDEWGFGAEGRSLPAALGPDEPFPSFDQLATRLADGGNPVGRAEGEGPVVRTTPLGDGQVIRFEADAGTAFRGRPTRPAVQTLQRLLGRDKGGVPVTLDGPDGRAACAHIGVFEDAAGALIVCVQQYDPFAPADAPPPARPPVAHGHQLTVRVPGVSRAEFCVAGVSDAQCRRPAPPWALQTTREADALHVALPPYDWGLVVRVPR